MLPDSLIYPIKNCTNKDKYICKVFILEHFISEKTANTR